MKTVIEFVGPFLPLTVKNTAEEIRSKIRSHTTPHDRFIILTPYGDNNTVNTVYVNPSHILMMWEEE